MSSIDTVMRKARKAFRLTWTGVWRDGLMKGVAATVEHDALPLARHFRTVIDVGANRGQFLLYAKARYASARIICFEPLLRPRSKLEQFATGDPLVEVVPAAAGAQSGRAAMNVSQADDSSSLLNMTELQISMFPGTGKAGNEEVQIVALDDFFGGRAIERPALLKIDVQGYELEVLRGSEALLSKVDSIIVECSSVEFYQGQALFEDVLDFLKDRGFSVKGRNVTAKSQTAWLQGDFLFEKAARV